MVRQIIPAVGAVLGVLVLVFMASNLSKLLGTAPESPMPWLIAGIVLVVGVLGLLWGAYLRRTRPDVYDQIGKGTPDPLTVLDQRLSDLAI